MPRSSKRSRAQQGHPGGSVVLELAQQDARIDRYLLYAAVVIVALIAGLGGWAGATRISGAVVASGRISVEANSKSVQHLEGGIVTKLAVKDGQRVAKGELLLKLDAGQTNEQINGLESQVRAKTDQLKLLRSELDDLEKLAIKRLVPRSQLAKAQRDYAELEGESGRLASELKRVDTNRQRLEVRAPISGRVHGLQVHTVGGVVAAGQEILKIVPTGARLIVEGEVQPSDIDQVARGQRVAIVLSSFNQRTTPELKGEVINVSADLVADERKQNYHYIAHIVFDTGEVERLGQRTLVPGMPAEVFIQTDERTVMTYLLKPLTDQFKRALREE